jgi:predicted permease
MSAWRRLFRSERNKEDMDAEIAAHLALAAADKRERGAESEAARQQAEQEFGNIALVKDVTQANWGWPWIERLRQDLKYALRQLRKSPGFAITAILTLALGIGANIAIFQLIYAVMLRSLPVPHPEELVQLKTRSGSGGDPYGYLHYSMYKGMSNQHALSGLCGWYSGWVTTHVEDQPVELKSPNVTGDCFATLGVNPLIGRLIQPSDDTPDPGAQGYATVLSYAYWNSRFHRDPNVIGKRLTVLNGFSQPKLLVIVGVLPSGFQGLSVGDEPDIYLPSYFMGINSRDEQGGGSATGMQMLGRLRPGQNILQAEAQLQPYFRSWINEKKSVMVGGDDAKGKLVLTRNPVGFSDLEGQYGKELKLLQIMVAIILVAGCAYLSTLLSARAVVRRREFAIRSALGASRKRLVGQSLIESGLLVFTGAGIGLLVAWGAAKFLIHFISTQRKEVSLDVHPGNAALLFAFGISLIAMLLMGLLPAWRASRTNVIADIKETKSSLLNARRGKLGSILLPVQIALSLLVIIVSALSAASLMRMLLQHNGYRMSGTIFVSTDIPMVMVDKDKKDDGRVKSTLTMYDTLLERLNHTPGIRAASLNMIHPLQGVMYMMPISSRYRQSEQVMTQDGPLVNQIAPHYFEAMGTQLLAGRDFRRSDSASSQEVCILSKSAAEYFFPGMSAIGQSLSDGKENILVVGLVEDTRFTGLDTHASKLVYFPFSQETETVSQMEIVLRADDIEGATSLLRDRLHELAGAHIARVTPIQETVKEATSSTRLLTLLSISLAALALLLSAVGIFGLLSYSVSQRTAEIGVRMALGASRGNIFTVLLRQAALLVLPGLLLGTVTAILTTRFMASMLYQTKPLDPLALGASMVALLLVGAIASYLPARRASQVEPMDALRAE